MEHGNLALLDGFLAPNVACRFYGLAEVNGLTAVKQMAPAFAASFSRNSFTIEMIIAEDDLVAIHGHETFNSYFDERWKAAGLQCLIAQDNISWTPRYSEQASELGNYLQKFGQQPKLRARLSYQVLKKE